jgi:hypothetical protein
LRTLLAVAAAVALPVAAAAPAAAAATTTSDAQVSVFHGVPELVADVYANGDLLLEDFQPGTVTDPLVLPAGEYALQVFPAGTDPSGDAAIEASATVPAGGNVTIAAHLSADGTPVLTPFLNDVSALAPGEARLTARHTAAVPAADIRTGGTPAFTGLSNLGQGVADLPAGVVSADVVLAGTDIVAVGPADLDLAEGVNTVVYAWGSAKDSEDLAFAVQTIDGLHGRPGGVRSGTGGLATDEMPWPLAAAGLAGAGTLALLGARAATRAASRARA